MTLSPSALGLMSILTADDTYFTRSFDSTRWTTRMDVKINNKRFLERVSCQPTRLNSKMEARISSSLLYASEKQERVAGIHYNYIITFSY